MIKKKIKKVSNKNIQNSQSLNESQAVRDMEQELNQIRYQNYIINHESLYYLKNISRYIQKRQTNTLSEFPIFDISKIVIQKLFMNVNEIYHFGYFLCNLIEKFSKTTIDLSCIKEECIKQFKVNLKNEEEQIQMFIHFTFIGFYTKALLNRSREVELIFQNFFILSNLLEKHYQKWLRSHEKYFDFDIVKFNQFLRTKTFDQNMDFHEEKDYNQIVSQIIELSKIHTFKEDKKEEKEEIKQELRTKQFKKSQKLKKEVQNNHLAVSHNSSFLQSNFFNLIQDKHLQRSNAMIEESQNIEQSGRINLKRNNYPANIQHSANFFINLSNTNDQLGQSININPNNFNQSINLNGQQSNVILTYSQLSFKDNEVKGEENDYKVESNQFDQLHFPLNQSMNINGSIPSFRPFQDNLIKQETPRKQ